MKVIKIQIEALAPYADLNPRIQALLHRFLLCETTDEEEKEIDRWMQVNEFNRALLEMLLGLEANNGGEATIMLQKLAKDRSDRHMRKWKQIGGVALTLLVLLVLAYFTFNR